MDKIMVTIYFVGIAAVVNVPPHNNVTKAVIFPAAARTVTYNGVPLHASSHLDSCDGTGKPERRLREARPARSRQPTSARRS